ncbi:heme o synthase [Leekyejoonella antrihumi]|uniref:Protoheme IX farnesyltransferase n=1 Tax=Leekyejoonella antrihumi TaxID=1660198 RepID=A0A563E7S5_9MICO|nr:heme o synthase [Leekyejoonella antrihumi]TWP38586.1 protoheme IX farnesyltransferase [Leekyejoonella antrihumi]
MSTRASSPAGGRIDGTDAALAARADGRGLRDTFTRYYSLTKPGVLYGNALTAAAGFALASAGYFHLGRFVALCLGSTMVIASACVLNNVLDRDIDTVMERTRKRATVTGSVPLQGAVAFSIGLGVIGMAVLVAWTNWLVVAVGVAGFACYVWLYGMLSKRMSIHGTLVGSVSGAAPIFAGYLAVTDRVDAGAIIAFAILFLWQMPEFYSIAIYRRDEYARAGVPVISVVKGIPHTIREILAYTVAFVVATLLLPVFGYVGIVYTVVMGALGIYWIWIGTLGLRAADPGAWARRMFRFSMVMILALCVMVAVGPVLP